MRIAVLGWGSLIRDPRELQISGRWHADGPLLPIEFARISDKGRLTLVLYPGADPVQTLWAISAHEDLNKARENLREREKTILKNVGYVSLLDNKSNCQSMPEICNSIRQWAEEKGLDAIIWTDLQTNFNDKTGMELSEENVITHLRGLTGEMLKKAEEYVRRAPAQVTTRIKSRIERELGWVLAQSCKKITEEARSIVELKKFCSACNQEKDITEIEICPQGESVRLSCGHRIISVEFTESLGISEQIMAKHFDSSHKLESRYKTKTSGETRRPARDNIVIDRDRNKIIHQVWEQNQNGEWELVHDEEKPI